MEIVFAVREFASDDLAAADGVVCAETVARRFIDDLISGINIIRRAK